jgi:hypothetical protein
MGLLRRVLARFLGLAEILNGTGIRGIPKEVAFNPDGSGNRRLSLLGVLGVLRGVGPPRGNERGWAPSG